MCSYNGGGDVNYRGTSCSGSSSSSSGRGLSGRGQEQGITVDDVGVLLR